MPLKLFTLVTHAIVTVPLWDDATAMGIRAMVKFCYGPGDDTALSQIRLMKSAAGTYAWRVPHETWVESGHLQSQPVFQGDWLTQLCAAGAQALEQIRHDCGQPQYGTRYRVTFGANARAEVITDGIAA